MAGWLGGWAAGWLGGWAAGWLGGWAARAPPPPRPHRLPPTDRNPPVPQEDPFLCSATTQLFNLGPNVIVMQLGHVVLNIILYGYKKNPGFVSIHNQLRWNVVQSTHIYQGQQKGSLNLLKIIGEGSLSFANTAP